MKKDKLFLLIMMCLACSISKAQIAINNNGSTADESAILDVQSTSKGMLIPTMTKADRDLIETPANGLMIYQSDDTEGFYYYNGTSWSMIGANPNDVQANSAGITTISSRQRLSVSQSAGLPITSYNSFLETGLHLNIVGRGRDVLFIASINVNNTVNINPIQVTVDFELRYNAISKREETVVLPADSRQLVTIQWLERNLTTATQDFNIKVRANNRVDLENRLLYAIEL